MLFGSPSTLYTRALFDPRAPTALLVVQEDLLERLVVADDVVDDQQRHVCLPLAGRAASP